MTFKMSQEERDTVHALYKELREQGKGKTEIYQELAETTGKTPSAVSSLIWRMENPDKEKENQRKKNQQEKNQRKKKSKAEPTREYDPEQFIQHYKGLVEENKVLKDELSTLKKEFDELRQSLSCILSKTGPKGKTDKDQDTNNFYIVSVETERQKEEK